MNKFLNSKKTFYGIVVIVLLLWIFGTSIPAPNCEQKRFGLQIFHWDICKDMSPLTNFWYVSLGVLTLLGSAYVIALAVLFLKSETCS